MHERKVDEDLKTRVAWLYYVEGMTQEGVARRVGLTRARVLRILAQARGDGTVQFRVTTRLTRCVELERQLESVWNLERAIVVPTPADERQLQPIIGRALGAYLSASLEPDLTIGLGWGQTLARGLPAIEPRGPSGLTIISLLGGLTRVMEVNPSEFAWRVADRLSAECYMMAAPVFAPDTQTRNALLRHPGIAEVLRRAQSLDLAVISAGDLTPHSVFSRYRLLTCEEIATLERAGAVGDVLCHFLNADGEPVDHPVNTRVCSVDLDRLRRARKIVLASGGWHKVTILHAALRSLRPAVVITDETAAERLGQG